ncbi:hypothetical protein AURDEDRAFT_171042 [Auricularia subglabra TFB-10046 SS5]|nr:hypothetical protein AURDEDRAFT_171042 [Auricularia subglabra TFB-10046 SS5]
MTPPGLTASSSSSEAQSTRLAGALATDAHAVAREGEHVDAYDDPVRVPGRRCSGSDDLVADLVRADVVARARPRGPGHRPHGLSPVLCSVIAGCETHREHRLRRASRLTSALPGVGPEPPSPPALSWPKFELLGGVSVRGRRRLASAQADVDKARSEGEAKARDLQGRLEHQEALVTSLRPALQTTEGSKGESDALLEAK